VALGQPVASAVSRDLRHFAGATTGNDPYIIDLASGDDVTIDVGQAGLSSDAMAFDPSGSTLAVVTHAGVVLWDVASSRLKGELTGIPGAYQDITIGNGGAVAAAVGERGVAVWSLNAEPPLAQRIEPSGISRPDELPNVVRGALSAAFSPDGNLLAWTANDNTPVHGSLFVVVWDLKNGRERTRLPGEQVVSFSPDGNRIATKAFDTGDMVDVTDLGSGRVEQYPAVPWTTPAVGASDQGAQPSEPPWQVDNGQGLGASIPADGTLALWDTTRTQRIGQIEIDVEPDAATLVFDAQGRRLAVTVSGGLAFIIDVNPDSWRTQACDRAARKLTESERATYLGSIAMENGCP
jgi:WD40 repeat protein